MSPDQKSARNHSQPQGPAACLASPLRRYGAALIDLSALLALGIVVMAALLFLVSPEYVASAFSGIAACYSLLYLILFWARGQTIGKRLFNIKVVGPDGNPPGLRRAALRYVGYVIASIPFKIGLLAILWDPLRRGWHDRIAGTLVVKADASEVPAPLPETQPMSAEESAPGAIRWSDLAMLPVFAVATALLTWPAAARLPSQFPSDGGDANLFVWNLWLFRKSVLDPSLSVFHTDYIFWPHGISTRLHSFSFFNCALGVPLQRVLSIETTYSLLMLLALCLTAFAAYLVGKYVTGSRAGGLLAGLFFGFCPYMVWHAYGHLDLVSSEWAVIYILLVVVLLKKARARHALLAGASLALAGLCAWYHLTHMAVFTAAFAIAWLVVHPKSIARRIALLAVAGAVCLALLAPLVIPMAREFRSGAYEYERATARGRAALISLDAGSLVVPPPYHPLFGRWTKDIYLDRLHPGTGVEQAAYLGWSVVALTLVAVWDRRRRRAHLPWLAAAVVAILVSFGFRLYVFNYPGLPFWLALAAGGPPGAGMEAPIFPHLVQNVSLGLLGGAPETMQGAFAVEMPWGWLWKIGGPMRLSSAPSRFAQVANLCLAVLAAVGALRLADRARAKWGKRGAAMALAAAGVVVMLEFLIAPKFPTERSAMYPFYSQLARERDCKAILEVPIKRLGDSHNQRAQTIHGKHLYVGFVSRIPDNAYDFFDAHPLLSKALIVPQGGKPRAPRSWLGLALLGERAFSSEMLSTYRADLRALSDTGCCYIVIHKGSTEERSLRLAQRLLGHELKLPIALDDRELLVYRIPHRAN